MRLVARTRITCDVCGREDLQDSIDGPLIVRLLAEHHDHEVRDADVCSRDCAKRAVDMVLDRVDGWEDTEWDKTDRVRFSKHVAQQGGANK